MMDTNHRYEADPSIYYDVDDTTWRNDRLLAEDEGADGGAAADDGIDVVAQMAKEISNLPLEERNNMFEEKHGIQTAPIENYEMIVRTLKELDALLTSRYPNVHQNDAHGGGGSNNNIVEDIENWSTLSPYEKSIKLNPNYAGGRKFRLMFLRACYYDPQQAMKRLETFLERQEELFGDRTLGRPLTFGDLDDNDIASLRSGCMMFLPNLDMAGRRVFIAVSKWHDRHNFDAHLRMRFYQISDVMWRNEYNEQQLGIVMIIYVVGISRRDLLNMDWKNLRRLPGMRRSYPLRATAYHFCYDDPSTKVLMDFVLKFCTKEHRMRNRAHFGTHTESQYHLMSYGIHPSMFTMDCDGRIRQDVVDAYVARLKLRHEREVAASSIFPNITPSSTSNSGSGAAMDMQDDKIESNPSVPSLGDVNNSGIGGDGDGNNKKNATDDIVLVSEDDITPHDVLMGRGVPIQTHKGNLTLAKLIEKDAKDHKEGSRFQKTFLTWKILKIIKEDNGGRFLEKIDDSSPSPSSSPASVIGEADSGSYWKEVDDMVARAKIAYGFRSLLKMQRAQQCRTKKAS